MTDSQKAKVTKEEKKNEAIRRMEILGIDENAIENFRKHDLVPFFITGMDTNRLCLYPPEDVLIRKLEKKHHMLVYCVIYSKMSYMGMESFLFVSDYPDEWEMDLEEAKDKYAMTWTENLNFPHLSEFGSIAVCTTDTGALYREC